MKAHEEVTSRCLTTCPPPPPSASPSLPHPPDALRHAPISRGPSRGSGGASHQSVPHIKVPRPGRAAWLWVSMLLTLRGVPGGDAGQGGAAAGPPTPDSMAGGLTLRPVNHLAREEAR